MIKDILEDGKEHLEWLEEKREREFPDFACGIPQALQVTLANFRTSVMSSNYCNEAQKIRRLVKDEIKVEISEGENNNMFQALEEFQISGDEEEDNAVNYIPELIPFCTKDYKDNDNEDEPYKP